MLRDRFGAGIGADMARFSSSLEVDLAMAAEDIRGSVAHARMLGAVGLVTSEEAEALVKGLTRVGEEMATGSWSPPADAEDIHMAVEERLTELVGEVGGKLHTARSRNDQVETDVRLWLRARVLDLESAIAGLIATLLDRVEGDGRTLLPGYTHLQRGQPILLGHHLLAHAWAFTRDRGRFGDARRRFDASPLGACAMAGTPLPIDREMTARELGFAGVVENAMDAVAARDHHQEVAAACAICATNLSRLAEELVLWSSAEMRFVTIGAEYATGSSIMPQKRNPDAAELVRGRAAAIQGDLVTLLSMVRGLPMAYNRDLQEGRHALFRAVESTGACVGVITGMWRGLTVHAERFETELRGDLSLATELADALVGAGVPFREAHGIVGRLVHWCEAHDCRLDQIPAAIRADFHPALAGDLTEWLDPRAAAERRTSHGGTAWAEIERQVTRLRKQDPSAPG